jgi:hypothetical protein
MAHGSMKDGGNTLSAKVQREDPAFIDEVMSMTSDQLKDKIVSLARNQEEILTAKEKDMDLLSLSEQLKTAKETYSLPLKAIKLKVKYLVEMLEAKGK